jgi:AraC-like DNA-binding protein
MRRDDPSLGETMSQDTLSDLLRAVRLRGAIYFFVEGHQPWVASAPAAGDLAPMILPSAGHLMEFHGVARGTCWAATDGESPARLEAGDLVLFPQGDPHVVSSAPGMRSPVPDFRQLLAPGGDERPFTLTCRDERVTLRRPASTETPSAVIVCGFLGLDARPFNPLLGSLPRMIHMPGAAAGPHSWIATFLRTAVDESGRRRPGGEALLERMSEMMFVDVLRRYLDGLPEGQTGWLAGLRDPGVGRVLALIHDRPGEPWTLESLGEAAALSRSVLHERFNHFVGQPPMQYLAAWRMQVAAGRLRDTDEKLIEIALDVGYESEAAFSRAFKRAAGMAPGAWRRSRRHDAPAPPRHHAVIRRT